MTIFIIAIGGGGVWLFARGIGDAFAGTSRYRWVRWIFWTGAAAAVSVLSTLGAVALTWMIGSFLVWNGTMDRVAGDAGLQPLGWFFLAVPLYTVIFLVGVARCQRVIGVANNALPVNDGRY